MSERKRLTTNDIPSIDTTFFDIQYYYITISLAVMQKNKLAEY
jgi:hypothetical protein